MATIDRPTTATGAMPQQATPTADADSKQMAKTVSEIVRDLLKPSPLIYWSDLIVSLLVANVAVGIYLYTDLLADKLKLAPSTAVWVAAIGLVVGGLAYYRASIFIHEIQHLRAGTFRYFKIFWNIFAGIPLLLPSFMYAEHGGHHRNRDYGTAGDAEYLQLMQQPWFSLLYMATRVFWLPLMFMGRFLILPPLAWIFPSVRKWTWRYASTIGGINLIHERPLPDADEERIWKLQETGACLYAWAVVGPILFGLAPWILLLKIYGLGVFIVSVSHTRTLTSHRFINEGAEMTYLEQLLDSTTIPGPPVITPLWCPVGMRFHALHHLVPSLPYHNMAEAHRRLMEKLPADSPYRQTLRSGLFDALGDVVGIARRQSRLLREQRAAG